MPPVPDFPICKSRTDAIHGAEGGLNFTRRCWHVDSSTGWHGIRHLSRQTVAGHARARCSARFLGFPRDATIAVMVFRARGAGAMEGDVRGRKLGIVTLKSKLPSFGTCTVVRERTCLGLGLVPNIGTTPGHDFFKFSRDMT